MKIGVIINNLSASQLSFSVIQNIKDIQKEYPEDDYVIFFENISAHVLTATCAVMNTTDIPSFDGVLIATNVETCLTAISSVSPSRKFFYVWDLEWIRQEGKNFQHNIKAYTNKTIKLISRSESHSKAIKNYSNVDPVGVVEDFNLKKMREIIQNEIC